MTDLEEFDVLTLVIWPLATLWVAGAMGSMLPWNPFINGACVAAVVGAATFIAGYATSRTNRGGEPDA